MTKDSDRLHEAIEKNRELIQEIKDDLVDEVTILKLSQQKLKYTVYFASVLAMFAIGRPELLAAMLHM